MPHKHKRRNKGDGESFNLPPTAIAKPLPTSHKAIEIHQQKRKGAGNRRGGNGKELQKISDDTPREFARLLNFQKTGKGLPKALDDGNIQKGKKRKREAEAEAEAKGSSKAESKVQDETAATTPEPVPSNPPDMKIRPGERLAEFSARVDQTLPIAGLLSKGNPKMKSEERRTKHNRRLERMHKQWREEEARRKKRLEEEMDDEAGEKEEEHRLLWSEIEARGGRKNNKKKSSKGTKAGDGGADEVEDLWAAELEKRRLESRQKNLQDVVRAPPQLKGVKDRLRDHGWAAVDVGNVPGSVGSLRKREEMGAVRRSVIDEYRKAMSSRNNQAVEAYP